MANREFKEPDYKIVATSYTYETTGETDDKGRPVFTQVGKPKKSTWKGGNNFKELKKSLYEKSQNNSDIHVNYEDQKYTAHYFGKNLTRVTKDSRRVKNVVDDSVPGKRVITYFKAEGKKTSATKNKM